MWPAVIFACGVVESAVVLFAPEALCVISYKRWKVRNAPQAVRFSLVAE